MNEKRYYAMAVNHQGESVEMRRIPEPDEKLAQREHELFPCDARWHADGYFHAPKLAIETREKRNGQWVVTDTRTFDREVR
jgi:hypothetical protein